MNDAVTATAAETAAAAAAADHRIRCKVRAYESI